MISGTLLNALSAIDEASDYRVYHHRAMDGDRILPCGGWTEAHVLNKDGEVIRTGIARCHPDDNYDKRLGWAIALGRAVSGPRTEKTGIGEVIYSARGFKFLPTLEDDRGTRIEVYESSAAEAPHVWIRLAGTWLQLNDGGVLITHVDDVDLTAHLSLELVDTLIAQLRWIRRHHYQNERSDEA